MDVGDAVRATRHLSRGVDRGTPGVVLERGIIKGYTVRFANGRILRGLGERDLTYDNWLAPYPGDLRAASGCLMPLALVGLGVAVAKHVITKTTR